MRKLPHVTALFWALKIAATTLGETGGDLLAQTLHVGYLISTAVFLAAFLVAVICQLRAGRFHPAIFWTVIALSSTAGTTLSDLLNRTGGIGYTSGAAILTTGLAIVFVIWWRSGQTLDVENVVTLRGELLFWVAILFSNSLGTSSGDFLADSVGLGFRDSALDDAAVVDSCKFAYGHVMNDDLAAWEALGDEYHARLANNYVTWVCPYVAPEPPPPPSPDDLARQAHNLDNRGPESGWHVLRQRCARGQSRPPDQPIELQFISRRSVPQGCWPSTFGRASLHTSGPGPMNHTDRHQHSSTYDGPASTTPDVEDPPSVAKTRECTNCHTTSTPRQPSSLHSTMTTPCCVKKLGEHGELIALKAHRTRGNVASYQRTGPSARRAAADHSLSS